MMVSMCIVFVSTSMTMSRESMPLHSFSYTITRSVFKDPISLVPKIGLCEHIENDLPTHESVILKKTDGNRTCSIFIRHSS